MFYVQITSPTRFSKPSYTNIFFLQSLWIPSKLIVKALKCIEKCNVNYLCQLRCIIRQLHETKWPLCVWGFYHADRPSWLVEYSSHKKLVRNFIRAALIKMVSDFERFQNLVGCLALIMWKKHVLCLKWHITTGGQAELYWLQF